MNVCFRSFLYGLALSLVCATSAWSGGGEKPLPLPKAKTIKELAERYDSSRCMECHEDIHDDWSESLHSRSILGSPRTAPTIITAVEKGLKLFPFSGVKEDQDIKVEHLMICAKCHLPQLEEATDDVAREIVATIKGWQQAGRDGDTKKMAELEATIASLNIGCMVCHNKMAIVHKWADGYPQPDTVYGSQEGDHEDEVANKMAVAPALGESIFCGQCHGSGPNFELDNPSQCATLYGSYLFAYVAHGGSESCQECHMQKSGLGHNMQSYKDDEMIAMAVDVKVEGRSLFWRKNKAEGVVPIGVINVELYNKTGHVIPDGWPTPNRLVLEVTANNVEGEQVYSKQKIYMPFPGRLGRGKEMGRGPYEKSGLLRETSLPPLARVHETFEITYPFKDVVQAETGQTRRELVNDQLEVAVKLWYLPFGEFDGYEVEWFSAEKQLDLQTEWVWR